MGCRARDMWAARRTRGTVTQIVDDALIDLDAHRLNIILRRLLDDLDRHVVIAIDRHPLHRFRGRALVDDLTGGLAARRRVKRRIRDASTSGLARCRRTIDDIAPTLLGLARGRLSRDAAVTSLTGLTGISCLRRGRRSLLASIALVLLRGGSLAPVHDRCACERTDPGIPDHSHVSMLLKM